MRSLGHPRPRLVDTAILAAVLAAAATGAGSLLAGRPGAAWMFMVHGVTGLALVVLLALKLRRVAVRVTRPGNWTRTTAVSVAALCVAAATLATGVLWVLGVSFGVWRWTGLVVHAALGLLLLPVLAVHLLARWRPPRRVDLEGRRTALQALVLVGGGVLAWRLGQALGVVLGAGDRFTGSRDAGGAGNDFPVTSWVADDPDPVDPASWSLVVTGAVDRELTLDADALHGPDAIEATLDCTSGWYADREWRGVRVGRLLDAAGVRGAARWVSVRSVTGYRWSLPLDEASEALLVTHVDGDPLSHGHGAPVRLVAPGRRGFQWVKWVTAVEVSRSPDYGQWVAIFASGFR